MSSDILFGERSAFIPYTSSRISYAGKWENGSMATVPGEIHSFKVLGRRDVGSFEIEFIASQYLLRLESYSSTNRTPTCTLDNQTLRGDACLSSTNLTPGSHVLNVSFGIQGMSKDEGLEWQLEGMGYTMPTGSEEDSTVFEYLKGGETDVLLWETDRNITWQADRESHWNWTELFDDKYVTPLQNDSLLTLTFFGSGLAFEIETDDMTKWRYTLDNETVPSRQQKVSFPNLCYGTHNFTLHYLIPEGGEIGEDRLQVPFSASQPRASSTPAICSFATTADSTPTPTITPDTSPTPIPSPRNKAPIIGGVAGAVAFLLLLLLGSYLVFLRRKARARADSVNKPKLTPFPMLRSLIGHGRVQLPPEKIISSTSPVSDPPPSGHVDGHSLRSQTLNSQRSVPPKVQQRDLPATPITTALLERYEVEELALPEDLSDNVSHAGPVVHHLDSGIRIGPTGHMERPIRAGRDVPPEYTDV